MIWHWVNLSDRRLEFHPRQNIIFKIDAWSDFDQLQSIVFQSKHGTFGDIQHIGGSSARMFGGKADVLKAPDEFIGRTFFDNGQSPIVAEYFQATCGKRTAEHKLFGIVGDIGKAADTSQAGSKS